MDKDFFKGKKITVFGLGLHGGGVGTVKFLAMHGASVIATDLRTKDQLASSLEKLKGLKNVQYVLGQHRPEDFIKTDMVIKNPAIPWSDKHIKLALDNKIPVEMDSTLFFKFCKNPIIGVTGTKGKTTTATFIYEILKSAGKDAVKVGIGQASVLDKLSVLKKDSVVVFELSSWRLSGLGRYKLSPHIAVFKNILPDHLNYYKNMQAYLEDKKQIFLHQKPKDWLIINQDDEIVREATKESNSQIFRFSYSQLQDNNSVFIDNGFIYLNNGIDIKKLCSLDQIKIPGNHNLSNVMAAIAAAHCFGLTELQIKKALPLLRGIPHRLEFVRELNGVRYYNDTAATIPDAAMMALDSFDRPIVLIAGGTNKELKFSEFGKAIAEKVKKIIIFKGNVAEDLQIAIRKNLNGSKDLGMQIATNMDEAVALAKENASEGDIVLLSPGAASFGLFLNEFDRGEKFREAVARLK